jgi:hypothetical protein
MKLASLFASPSKVPHAAPRFEKPTIDEAADKDRRKIRAAF